MSKIQSIGTAVPGFKHDQQHILDFMERVYAVGDVEKRKLKFLYRQGGINTRYSVIPDYSLKASEWQFYPASESLEPFPTLEQRMQWYQHYAAALSVKAVDDCIETPSRKNITHLITVSCTGMSAPGLDLELLEMLELPATISRSSVNFMGCYAAIHALKMADAYCKADSFAQVLIVCTELCTLHFQKEYSIDNITSSMLFADGAAAVLVTGDNVEGGVSIRSFYSTVASRGKKDMAWQLSSHGFLMTLSAYIPEMIAEDFDALVNNALQHSGVPRESINQWCIHPGGKKILEAVKTSLSLGEDDLRHSYDVLADYGNMSSPTVLFVLKKILAQVEQGSGENIFGAAFGPGLTLETFTLSA